jgi:VCBS repeat-containing protein
VKQNLPPDADNDYYTAKKNTTLTVSADDGVLDGDSDPNGDAITAVLVSGPAHGTLTLNANGSFVYKPALNYTGTDTFVYQAKDPLGLTDTATVTIRVGVSSGHDDGHSSQHHNGDGCDHELHRNGHFDGDDCEHDRGVWWW